jgi:hypothetical protein
MSEELRIRVSLFEKLVKKHLKKTKVVGIKKCKTANETLLKQYVFSVVNIKYKIKD